MADKRLTITLINSSKTTVWFRKLVSIVGAVCAPIAIGAYLESSAMQWVGFIFGSVTVIGMAVSESKKNTFDNIEAAKRRLDEFASEA